mgnify:CR=1 FL=1
MTQKRNVDLVVISDIHLGTYGCQAEALSNYLNSICPKTVVLNGDIIDIWQFKKRYWPKSHMKIIKHILNLVTEGVTVFYVTGNHDELLRKFAGFEINSFKVVNKVVLTLEDKKAWIFHGDVFDVTMQYSKWLTKLGAIGYDILILINNIVNKISQFFGKGKISLSKRIKDSVKSAVKFINNFEETASDIAITNGYDYVICGHIHQPKIRTYSNSNGLVQYLNSGDWIENLTSLEYHNGQWTIFYYKEEDFKNNSIYDNYDNTEKSNKELFNALLNEFNISKNY